MAVKWRKFHRIPTKKEIQFDVGQIGVHCGTSCKIRTPRDTNCGNESKIHLKSKILLFYALFDT